MGATAPFVPFATAGDATIAAGGGGAAPGASGVFGIEPPFMWMACGWGCDGGGSEWAWWGT